MAPAKSFRVEEKIQGEWQPVSFSGLPHTFSSSDQAMLRVKQMYPDKAVLIESGYPVEHVGVRVKEVS